MQLENLREKWSGDWETQQTDYPRTRPDLPNHEPRGCPRGASLWYLYSANRLKYPLMRKRLMKMWREAKRLHSDPVDAWASIIEDADKAKVSSKRAVVVVLYVLHGRK